MADHHHIESPDGQVALTQQLAVLDEQLIELWHTRTRVAAQLLTPAQLAVDRAAARRYARRLGRRVGAALADLLRVHTAAYRDVQRAMHHSPAAERTAAPATPTAHRSKGRPPVMYTVDVYPGRDLTAGELAALGSHYTPDDNGLRRGKLRLAATSAAMAATTALDVFRDRTGVEAVVEVQRPVTWAGPIEA